MRVISLFNLVPVAAGLTAMLLAYPADAQGQRDGTGLRTDDLLSIQVYVVGGGFIPFASSSNLTGIDASVGPGSSQSGGGSPSVAPLVGGRVHVPMFWYMRDEHRLGFSIFFETGFQSGLSGQSFLQTFQNTSPTTQDFGSSTITEYWQIPLLLGVTVPIAGRSAAPWTLLDLYGGLTLDSWGQILQGAEGNAPGAQGFYGQNRRFSADPTVGVGVRVPVGRLGDELPIFVGMNAELQFRPGSVVSADSPNFPVTYVGSVDAHANLAVMARIGIAFGSR